MRLRCYIYIMLILMRSSTIVFGDNAERVYSLDDKVKCCSRWLSIIIFNFCNNAYKIVKRDDFEDVDLHGDWPWTGRRGALSADWTRYKRQGIVNECCFKPCTTDVLLKYC
ncbi:bombyxin A-2 homolog isoform X5 [Bombyx mori]|uniref:bombyxin A-2 homolog isoform X5 n=1 Tax=Bombyx mori TaxID=7091 RepID=UPI002ED10C96